MLKDESAWAYDLGFRHGLAGYEKPVTGEACRFYIMGYNAATRR